MEVIIMKGQRPIEPLDPLLPNGKVRQAKTRRQMIAYQKWAALPINAQIKLRQINRQLKQLLRWRKQIIG